MTATPITPSATYRPRSYDFPRRVATPELARRELHRLEASQGKAHAHGDVRACRYLAARLARVAPYLKPQHRTTMDGDPS